MPLGGIVSLAILWPNILWLCFVSATVPTGDAGPAKSGWSVMAALEGAGRVAVFTLPFFYRIEIAGRTARTCLAIMALALCIYYLCWLRYFRQGRSRMLLFAPLLGLPVPMAIFPVMYFMAAAVVLHAAPLAIVTVAFGIGHIYQSRVEYQRLRSMPAQPL
jgi:hypothetical protein